MTDKKPVILYVEDDAGSRKTMQLLVERMLQFPGLTILEDSTDFAAKIEALDPHPDLVLLDIHVAPYNGFDMLKMLRETTAYQKTPIVALTASVMNEEVQQLKSAGFDSVIAKPINIDTFPQLIQRIINGEQIWTVMS